MCSIICRDNNIYYNRAKILLEKGSNMDFLRLKMRTLLTAKHFLGKIVFIFL